MNRRTSTCIRSRCGTIGTRVRIEWGIGQKGRVKGIGDGITNKRQWSVTNLLNNIVDGESPPVYPQQNPSESLIGTLSARNSWKRKLINFPVRQATTIDFQSKTSCLIMQGKITAIPTTATSTHERKKITSKEKNPWNMFTVIVDRGGKYSQRIANKFNMNSKPFFYWLVKFQINSKWVILITIYRYKYHPFL